MREKTVCSYHTNRRMNQDTYRLRRQVMGYVYEAKKLLNNQMPRVDIRITDCDEEGVLGTARMGERVVWIPASTIDKNPEYLRQVVFHELCHALWATPHNNFCPLMAPFVKGKPLSKEATHETFLRYCK